MRKPVVIIALDDDNDAAMYALVDKLNPNDCALKVGKTLYTRYGPALVKNVQTRGFKIFLDLKFHDIPKQVAGACQAAADLGVWMLTLHASGGTNMMTAARKAVAGYADHAPLLMAVTILTSLDEPALKAVGFNQAPADAVLNLASLAQEAGMDGVVSSPQELSVLRAHCKSDFKLLTPGIRPPNLAVSNDDQARVLTAKQACELGADYLVIGRPITQADNPENALKNILLDIK